MRFFSTIFGSALFIGFHVLFLWLSTNRLFQINQVGLLERQVWPINDVVSMSVCGVIWGLLVGIQRARREYVHACEVAELCTRMGFSYASIAVKEKWESLPVCDSWRNGFDEMAGTMEGWQFRMVDMEPQIMARRAIFQRKTIAMVEVGDMTGLPEFHLSPRGWGGGGTAWAGFRGMAFDLGSVPDLDCKKVIKEFDQIFELIPLAIQNSLSAWGASASTKKIEQEEARVRLLFSIPVMALLVCYPWVSLQAKKGKLAIWRGEKCLGAPSRPEFLEVIAEICHVLAASAIQREPVQIATSERGGGLGGQVRRYWATIQGGLAGMFLGFFAGFFAFVAISRFQLGPKNFFLLESLLFFGCVITGALLGGVCGAILMNQFDRLLGKLRKKPAVKS